MFPIPGAHKMEANILTPRSETQVSEYDTISNNTNLGIVPASSRDGMFTSRLKDGSAGFVVLLNAVCSSARKTAPSRVPLGTQPSSHLVRSLVEPTRRVYSTGKSQEAADYPREGTKYRGPRRHRPRLACHHKDGLRNKLSASSAPRRWPSELIHTRDTAK